MVELPLSGSIIEINPGVIPLPNHSLSVLMVDASLFTAPYDEGVTNGLEANETTVIWACRDPRPNEENYLLRERRVAGIFYPGFIASVKNAGVRAKIMKGLSHAVSLIRLWRYVVRTRPDVVHFQWIVFPILDRFCISAIRRTAPVVLTIHDTIPFNNNPTSKLQTIGLARVMTLVDHIIVHTQQAAATIQNITKGNTAISVVAHGPLGQPDMNLQIRPSSEPRWTVVMFGKLQAYKGVDILVEALALLKPELRHKIRVIVAGEAIMDIAPILSLAHKSGVEDCIEFRSWRHSDSEVAKLLSEADTFVFPYRQIDASGVFYLVAAYGKWLIASDIGIFHETIQHGANGFLVQPEDASALSDALADAIGKISTVPLPVEPWSVIGKHTREIYERLIENRSNIITIDMARSF